MPGSDGKETIEYRTPYEWRAYFDGTGSEWPMPWEGSKIPQFGQLLSYVKPQELQTSDRKVESRGTPAIFVGLHEHKGGKPDGSILVVPLPEFLESDKISFLRTKDFRIPKLLQFPMAT